MACQPAFSWKALLIAFKQHDEESAPGFFTQWHICDITFTIRQRWNRCSGYANLYQTRPHILHPTWGRNFMNQPIFWQLRQLIANAKQLQNHTPGSTTTIN
jgi:hypothetical protein